jgi:hypothetical protein
LVAPARADDRYPYAGVFSVLDAFSEKHYEMTKFLCLASFNIQRADGSYTAYHIDTRTLGGSDIKFHPYEAGTCAYDAAKKTEHCKVSRSNWGKYEYFIEHRGEADGAFVQGVVDMRNPTEVKVSNMRKCPFEETRIAPFLSGEWLYESDDDLSWVLYRHFPFNVEQGAKVAKILGIAP